MKITFTNRDEILNLLKELGITKKTLIENKSRLSNVLYNYYKETNINEGFDKFLQKVLKKLS